MGEYRKRHPIESEMAEGVWPGPAEPPVFETDFGRIGIQVCCAIHYEAPWRRLGELGAELVFWPTAFAGGQLLNARARENYYCVVSSTNKDAVRICDLTGDELCHSGGWQSRRLSAPVNLERAALHPWPYVRHFPAMQAKYGRRLRLQTLHE